MERIKFPALDEPLPPNFRSDETLHLLANRRSASAGLLMAPGPQGTVLEDLLLIASRVPDHRKLAPFRFLTFDDDARTSFAEMLVSISSSNEIAKDLPDDAVRTLVMRAPTMVALISSVNPSHRTPIWEQELTAGAVGFNLLIAASSMGFAGQWITDWMAFDRNVDAILGLQENERFAGYFFFGTASCQPKERSRPSKEDIIASWTAPKA